jgi:hypothetical protein
VREENYSLLMKKELRFGYVIEILGGHLKFQYVKAKVFLFCSYRKKVEDSLKSMSFLT